MANTTQQVLGGPVHGGKFVLGFRWTYCIHGGKFALGFGWGLIHGGKFVLGFGWAYTCREVCVRFWVRLYMEGSVC